MSTIQNKVRALSRGGKIVVTDILNLAGSIISLIQTKFKFYQKRGSAGMSLTEYCWCFLGLKLKPHEKKLYFFLNRSDKHPCYH